MKIYTRLYFYRWETNYTMLYCYFKVFCMGLIGCRVVPQGFKGRKLSDQPYRYRVNLPKLAQNIVLS